MIKSVKQFKEYIQFFPLNSQILEVKNMIDLMNKSNLPGYRIHKKLRVLKQLHSLKKDLINKR